MYLQRIPIEIYAGKRKSENMFLKTKSSDPDLFFNNLTNSLKRIENEQVHQRKDLSIINVLLKSLMADIGIQKQVDDYFEKDLQETSPQTDSETT